MVRGTSNVLQGSYHAYNDAAIETNLDIGDPTNPRLDSLIVRVRDSVEVTTDTTDEIVVEYLKGTPTAGATLDNRTGATPLPPSSQLLADFLVPAGAAALTAGMFRDRRIFSRRDVLPPIKSAIEGVIPRPPAELPVRDPIGLAGAQNATDIQVAYLVHIPTTIVATRIRWSYVQGATALTGNTNFGIYDSSGRLIVATGSQPITGAANAAVPRADAIAATTFYAGQYWVLFQLDATNAGTWSFHQASLSLDTNANRLFSPAPHILLDKAGTSVVAPDHINDFTDCNPQGAATTTGSPVLVPIIALTTA